MGPRGKAPGLKRGRTLRDGTSLLYWMAKQVVRNPMDFPDSSVPLPRGADDEMLAELCQEHTARLFAWIDARKRESAEPEIKIITRFDGTVKSGSRIYQEHPRSHFHKIKSNTRATYVSTLKLIEDTVGLRLFRRLTVFDVEHWYEEWRKPAIHTDADGNKIVGPERIKRAHEAVTMFRTVLRFLAGLRLPNCKQLDDELSKVKFEKAAAREVEMTYGHVIAFIRAALDLGGKGVIPMARARYMAIGVTAQFDLLLRQKDIIGEWPKTIMDQDTAVRRGATAISYDGEVWTGYFTWENIPGWRWRTKTSKSKYRAAADFDLSKYSLLFPLLDAVPHEDRTGPIVKGESDLPVRQSSYGKWFRQIARAAGIPDEVWNMDSRAGGATEADDSCADLDAIQAALTHSKKETTLRYIRRSSAKIATVAEARARKRASKEKSE
jgi:hypothetical protein